MRQPSGFFRALSLAGGMTAVLAFSQAPPASPPGSAETPAPALAETPTPTPAEVVPPQTATPAAEPTSTPTARPTPLPTSTPVPMSAPLLRLADVPAMSISRLPAENPFGLAAEEPAALPPKPAFPETVVPASLFAAIRVDASGKVTGAKIVRDPIPSLAAESKRSFEQRWAFDPAVKAGQPVETWASIRLDLQVEVRPREEQATLTPVTPATALPAPFEWGDDAKWYENFRSAPPADGTVAVDLVDTTPTPKRTRWSADSYKGPFSCRLWVKVSAAGRIEKLIPIQASDPVLVAYMRRTISSWIVKPARAKGQAVDSWGELSMSGQLSYSIEVKQVVNLHKSLARP
jgi:hypothetical protein